MLPASTEVEPQKTVTSSGHVPVDVHFRKVVGNAPVPDDDMLSTAAPSEAQSTNLEPAETAYLWRHELRQFDMPPCDQTAVNILANLCAPSSDWATHFAALNDTRRLAIFAPRLLMVQQRLPTALRRILLFAESPRSSLAKNALRCLGLYSQPMGGNWGGCLMTV